MKTRGYNHRINVVILKFLDKLNEEDSMRTQELTI